MSGSALSIFHYTLFLAFVNLVGAKCASFRFRLTPKTALRSLVPPLPRRHKLHIHRPRLTPEPLSFRCSGSHPKICGFLGGLRTRGRESQIRFVSSPRRKRIKNRNPSEGTRHSKKRHRQQNKKKSPPLLLERGASHSVSPCGNCQLRFTNSENPIRQVSSKQR